MRSVLADWEMPLDWLCSESYAGVKPIYFPDLKWSCIPTTSYWLKAVKRNLIGCKR